MTAEHRDFDPLRPYVTNLDQDVYCIRGLPPEVAAVLFAYVSRSPNSFRDNLRALIEAGDLQGLTGRVESAGDEASFAGAKRRAERFHKKWVVGYGHASVAEHATLRFALESVSIIASKVLEDNRLGSYTEKSTRYQRFSPDDFIVPPDLAGSSAGRLLEETCRMLLARYDAFQGPLERHVASLWPRVPSVSEGAWRRAVAARVFDVSRYLMPAATRTALGVTMNARVATHAINKLLSHPLAECRALGASMLAEGRKICPTLLRHAGPKAFLSHSAGACAEFGVSLPPAGAGARENSVKLTAFDADGPERVIKALLFELGGPDAATLDDYVRNLDGATRVRIIEAALAKRDSHDWPPRAFEMARYVMEVTIDYGAFRDIQRHRMATQLSPPLDVSLGYETPPELRGAGLEEEYHDTMRQAATAWGKLAEVSPLVAQYVVPLAYRKRVLFDWNLREIEHFVKLRSGREGHRSYRHIAWEVADRVAEVHPELGRILTVDRQEYSLERLLAEERAARRRAAAE